MPQVPTARGIKIRSASDAHLLFYAVHLQRLPIIQRRLDATERMEVSSGAVFVWEERSASTTGSKMEPDSGPAAGVISGIERWTDGLKWGPSRVRDDFLFYQEKDPEPSVSPPPLSQNHLYRGKRGGQPESLIKQTYSVHYYPQVVEGKPPTEPARKWHLTAYQCASSIERLADVTSVPELQGISPPDGLFRKARIGKKRDPVPGQNSNISATPTMNSSNYPLEPYAPGPGMNGIRPPTSGSAGYGRMEHGRESSITSSGWREDSASDMSLQHRPAPLLPQHPPPQGLAQDGYSPSYPPSHNGHDQPPAPNGDYHNSSYPPSHGHFPSSNGHGPHHSHSGSMGYGEPHSPYGHAHPHPHGGNYGGPAGYPPYPDGPVAYGRAPEGNYEGQPASHESPSPTHVVPVTRNPPQSSMQHNQPYHHHPPPPPSTNGQTNYDPYNSSNPAPYQNGLHQSSHHAGSAPPPPHATIGQIRHPHSYSFSNGQPISDSSHPRHGTPHMQHLHGESHPYQNTPQQRPIMPHQATPIDHHRSFSQSSQAIPGAIEGVRSPPQGVARIRKGARKSEDNTPLRQMMSRSPPSNHPMNGGAGAGRPAGGATDGGARAQFSPYTRPVNTPGPRQHPALTPHQSEVSTAPSSYEGSYGLRTNGSFSQNGNGSLHIRPPSASHPFATPSVPSIPPPPESHHYAPTMPTRTDMGQQAPPSTNGYYVPQGASRNGTYNDQPPLGQIDYSRPQSNGTWAGNVQSEQLSEPRQTPLQAHSAFPPPAGSSSNPPSSSHSHLAGMEPSKESVVGIPALPIGSTFPGHIAPHPNPNSSPILTHFQPASTSPASSRSGSNGSGSGMNGFHGFHQHMAAPNHNVWEAMSARGNTPAPPRIDTSIGGGVNSSPVSVTAGGSVSGSASSKLGPLTPSTNLPTRDPEDERVLVLLSRGVVGPGSKSTGENNVIPTGNGSGDGDGNGDE